MAEGVGFEPTRPFGLPVFRTGAINHSTTPPGITDREKCATPPKLSKVDRPVPLARCSAAKAACSMLRIGGEAAFV